MPDAIFMLFEDLIVFDHLKGLALVISNVNINSSTKLNEQYNAAQDRVDIIGKSLHSDLDYQSPLKVNQIQNH